MRFMAVGVSSSSLPRGNLDLWHMTCTCGTILQRCVMLSVYQKTGYYWGSFDERSAFRTKKQVAPKTINKLHRRDHRKVSNVFQFLEMFYHRRQGKILLMTASRTAENHGFIDRGVVCDREVNLSCKIGGNLRYDMGLLNWVKIIKFEACGVSGYTTILDLQRRLPRNFSLASLLPLFRSFKIMRSVSATFCRPG